MNKSKDGNKKGKTTTTDDTEQPGTKLINIFYEIFLYYISGATRKDWSKPDQVTGNDPTYGKASSSSDARNPDQGKK